MITLMRLLPSVGEHVSGEITSLREGFTADVACVWLLAGMHQHMITQSRLMSKGLATVITLVRLLASVDEHV